jgi:hypothetical protein
MEYWDFYIECEFMEYWDFYIEGEFYKRVHYFGYMQYLLGVLPDCLIEVNI